MSGKSNKGDRLTPDVLIPYPTTIDKMADASISMIGVRPETNKVSYEAAIIKAASPYAHIVYLANISGRLINEKAIVATHYSSQMQFTINSKEELRKYPEMITGFEQKFHTDFESAKIIGSYDAILDYKIKEDAEDLFDTMVPLEDFLEMYGQTIKRIGEFYVVNYDIPFVLTRHHKQSDMFVIAVQLKDKEHGFDDINHLIYDRICENKEINLLDFEKRKNLPWYDQVRRTYHISRSHIEAMFDLTDYVFHPDATRIKFTDTPLGAALVHHGVMDDVEVETRMSRLKDNPLVYLNEAEGNCRLTNIIREGRRRQGKAFIEKELRECCDIIDRINWRKSLK